MKDGSDFVRRGQWRIILILALCGLACCGPGAETTGVAVIWKDSLAVGLAIPRTLINSRSADTEERVLQIRRPGERSGLSVIGTYEVIHGSVVFTPVIPLQRGLRYDIFHGDDSIASIRIPAVSADNLPEVTGIFPGADTVPENLLKVYLFFSRPMAEADPLRFLRLVRNGRDTLRGAFLDLQPALWNREGTALTLWLDPGRIKRDLEPHLKDGNPLHAGESYDLIVLPSWPSKEAGASVKTYSKRFFVSARDAASPLPATWKISPPAAGTQDPVAIRFNERMDHVLLMDAVRILKNGTSAVPGRIETRDEDRTFLFFPEEAWSTLSYTVRCESRLEDLAGNNLNRLFDRDILAQPISGTEQFHDLTFAPR